MNKNTLGYLVLIVLLSVTSVFSIRLYFREKTAHDKVDIRRFPDAVGEWKAREINVTEEEYDILETRNLISRQYTNPKGEKIYLFIIYSETNRAVFHPPEVCLLGSGVAITDKRTERIDYGKRAFFANKLYTERADHKELGLYFYKAGNLYTGNFYYQQARLAFNQLFGKEVPGATIRVSMPIREDEKNTLSIMKPFLIQTISIVDNLK